MFGTDSTTSALAALMAKMGPAAFMKLLGRSAVSPLSMATMGDGRPDNSAADMSGLQSDYGATMAHNRTPAGRIARGWDQFGPQGAPQAPMLPTPPTPAPVDMGTPATPPALSAQAMAPPNNLPLAAAPAPQPAVPMPTARPDSAPQAPDPMGFFARNAAMMRDQNNDFLDPTNAARAQASQPSGPDVIAKLMSYFHDKADN